MTLFMKNGKVPLHNQVCELAARCVAVRRNGSPFCGSPRGAAAEAGLLSIIETAKANNLDPYKYLVYALELMSDEHFYENEQIMTDLMPWSERAQATCAADGEPEERFVELLGGIKVS